MSSSDQKCPCTVCGELGHWESSHAGDANKIKVMREALTLADTSLTTIRNAPGNTLNLHRISREAYEAHEAVKQVLL